VAEQITKLEHTWQYGSVRRLCTEISTFDMVSAKLQLCWIESMPTCPWRDTFGWKIRVRKRTIGGHMG